MVRTQFCHWTGSSPIHLLLRSFLSRERRVHHLKKIRRAEKLGSNLESLYDDYPHATRKKFHFLVFSRMPLLKASFIVL